MKISVIGLGVVGNAMLTSFNLLSNDKYTFYGYDKYKNGGIGNLENCLNSTIIFLVLPTEYNSITCEYDKTNIYSVLNELEVLKYSDCIVLKSTVEPTTTTFLQYKYKNMHFIHNPEFLSAVSAFEDFHNQTHIVLGKTLLCSNKYLQYLNQLYTDLYPNATISNCTSNESEMMKISCNSFYSIKIQFFNELYLLSKKINVDYDTVVSLMLKNNWINPMHTTVPGSDGKLSYGGMCFPKDTNALLQFMIKNNTPNKVLNACVEERNEMRQDNINIITENNYWNKKK